MERTRGFCKLMRLAALCGMAYAQSSQTLEVAAVKASGNTIAESNVDSVRGRLTATNITVKELIRLAYGMKDHQITGAPKWIDSARFDIVAKCRR